MAWNPGLGPSSLLGVPSLAGHCLPCPGHCLGLAPHFIFSSCHPVVDTRSTCPVALPVSSSFPGKQNSSFDLVATNLRDHTGFPGSWRHTLSVRENCGRFPSSCQGSVEKEHGLQFCRWDRRGFCWGLLQALLALQKGHEGGTCSLPRSLRRSGYWCRKRGFLVLWQPTG